MVIIFKIKNEMFKIISPLFFVAFIFVNAVASYFIKKANTVFVKKIL